MMTRTTGLLVRGIVAAVLGVALLLATGCAALSVALLHRCPCFGSSGTPPNLVFVIPRGTASADMRGAPIFTVPSAMTVLSGQSMVIQNDDQVMHYFAEVPIAPGRYLSQGVWAAGAFR